MFNILWSIESLIEDREIHPTAGHCTKEQKGKRSHKVSRQIQSESAGGLKTDDVNILEYVVPLMSYFFAIFVEISESLELTGGAVHSSEGVDCDGSKLCYIALPITVRDSAHCELAQ